MEALDDAWTQGWIVSVLALRQMGTSLWSLTEPVTLGPDFQELRRQMIPRDLAP